MYKSRYFLVCQNPYDVTHDQVYQKEVDVKAFMWFYKTGKGELKVQLEKSAYAYNETIELKCDIDNSH